MNTQNASAENSKALAPGTQFVGTPDTKLVAHFLRRLQHLVELRRESGRTLNKEGLRLLDKVIYSTYMDCQRLGLGEAASIILHGPAGKLEASAQKGLLSN